MESDFQILQADLLEAFAAFAETRSFTRAARRVHLSQPALFERVRRLALALDARLYERSGREIRLTETGARLAAFARESLGRTGEFVRDLRGDAPRVTVTLAAGEGSWLYCLGPAIARFGRSHPAVLRPITAGSSAALDAVRSGLADLAFTVCDLVPAGLLAEDVLRVPMCAALPPRHPKARSAKLPLAALRGERLVLPPTGRLYRELVARFAAKGGEDLPEPIEADGWPLMLSFVQAGLGIAVVNGSCRPPPKVVLRPIPELGTVPYRLLRRRDGRLSSAAEALASEIRALRGAWPTGGGTKRRSEPVE